MVRMKRNLALWLALFLSFSGGIPVIPAAPAFALESEFRQVSGGQAPQTQRDVEAGMEEAQLQELANWFFAGDKDAADQAVSAEVSNVGKTRREILIPLVDRSADWLTPDQIRAYRASHPPQIVTIGGGGTAAFWGPVATDLTWRQSHIAAMDDSGGNAGTGGFVQLGGYAPGDLRNARSRMRPPIIRDVVDIRLPKTLPKDVSAAVAAGNLPAVMAQIRQAVRQEMLRYRDDRRDAEGEVSPGLLNTPGGLFFAVNLDALIGRLGEIVAADTARFGRLRLAKANVGNLEALAESLATGAHPANGQIDPDRFEVALWLGEQAYGLADRHVTYPKREYTERIAVWSEALPHSKPIGGETLIGRVRTQQSYDAVDELRARGKLGDGDVDTVKGLRRIFTASRGTDGSVSIRYVTETKADGTTPYSAWELPDWSELSPQTRAFIETHLGEPLVLEGHKVPVERVYTISRDAGGNLVIRNLAGQGWVYQLHARVALRIHTRQSELEAQGKSPAVTMIVGEDESEEADIHYGTDDPADPQVWNIYHGRQRNLSDPTTPLPDAVAAIDAVQPGGLVAIAPGTHGASIWAVLDEPGIASALRRAVARGVRVVKFQNGTLDNGTWGRSHTRILEDDEFQFQVALNDPSVTLRQMITDVFINAVDPADSDIGFYKTARLGGDAQQAERYRGAFTVTDAGEPERIARQFKVNVWYEPVGKVEGKSFADRGATGFRIAAGYDTDRTVDLARRIVSGQPPTYAGLEQAALPAVETPATISRAAPTLTLLPQQFIAGIKAERRAAQVKSPATGIIAGYADERAIPYGVGLSHHLILPGGRPVPVAFVVEQADAELEKRLRQAGYAAVFRVGTDVTPDLAAAVSQAKDWLERRYEVRAPVELGVKEPIAQTLEEILQTRFGIDLDALLRSNPIFIGLLKEHIREAQQIFA